MNNNNNNNNFNIVSIYSDGGCRGNGKDNNIGAYAFIINYEKGFNSNSSIEEAKAFNNTTNNQMELLGVISALDRLEHPSIVTIYSDSKYVCDAINNGWITNWKKNGWLTAKKEPVKNQDLWIQLDKLVDKHHCKFSWVKGHSDNVLNNRCDDLLNIAMNNFNPNDNVNVNDVLNNSISVNNVEMDSSLLKRLINLRDELNDIISCLTT